MRSRAAPAARRASRDGCSAACATSPPCRAPARSMRGSPTARSSQLEVDARGLDALDHRYLRLIAVNYSGGPVGVETIAAALSEPRDAIEEIIEPYLLQQGFIARTPRGRVLTAQAFAHLGTRSAGAAGRPSSPCSTAATNDRRLAGPRGADRGRHACARRSASISRTPIAAASSITPTSSNSASAGARISSGCSASTRTVSPTAEAGEPAIFVVRHVEIDYFKPGRMDDVLEVVTTCVEIGSASLKLRSRRPARRDAHRSRASSPSCWSGARAKPQRLGALVRNALQRFVNQQRET